MSEGAVRKIQPFTIGTRLSIPSEHKCHDFTDTYLPRDEIQNYESDQAALYMGQPQRGLVTAKPACVADQVNSLDTQDERAEEDRNCISSPVCSRSIRKIAICSNAEAISVSPCDCDRDTSVKAAVNRSNSNSVDPNQASMGENLRKISDPQLKVDTWFKRNLEYGCNVLGSPSQDSEDTLPNQQRDLKDIENSLIQLTRSLDDEKKCKATYVDTDQRRDKQEKIGQRERKNIPSREKTITQTWLRLQTLLRNYHQDLKLALDVSSFYQQADNIICAMHGKRGHLSGSKDQRTSGYTEVKDIESQIMMLDETASRLSDLHPTLAARVTRKQAEVQESWGLLQEESRNIKPDQSTTHTIGLSCNDIGSSTQTREVQSTEEHEAHKIMGKNIKEEQNRLKEFQVMQVIEIHDKSTPDEKNRSPHNNYTYATCDCTSNLDGQIGEPLSRERKEHTAHSSTCPQRHRPELGILFQDSTISADKTLLWLKDNVAMELPHQNTDGVDAEMIKKQTETINKVDAISKRPKCCQSKSEEACEFHTQHQSNVDMKDRLRQVEKLWEVLRRASMIDTDSFDTHNLQDTWKDQLEPCLSGCQEPVDDVKPCIIPGVKSLSATLEDCKTGMMTELQRCLEQDKFNYQIPTKSTSDAEDVGNPMEELLGVLEDLSEAMNEREHSLYQHPNNPELICQNSTQTLHINQLLSRCAELSMDILDAETDMAVRCEPDNSGLEGLQEQQEELEMGYRIIKEEVVEMERLTSHVLAVLSEKAIGTWENVQTTLQSLEELTRSMAENQSRLQQFSELQDFLRTYLAIISWTDETCTCIFSDALANQDKLHELTKSSELDLKIQQKFEEFDAFAAAGQKLIAEGHHLTNIINERTDELQSMLGWMLAHWKVKKDQLNQEKPEELIKDISLPGTWMLSTRQPQCPHPGIDISKHSKSLLLKHRQGAAKIHIDGPKAEPESSHQGQSVNVSKYISHQGSVDVVAVSPSLVLEDPHTAITPLGGSINLILSFDQPTPVPSQPQGSQEQKETFETVHRVSTYLQVTDGNKVTSLMNKEVKSATTAGTTLQSASHQISSTTATYIQKLSTVALPSRTKTRSDSILSLNRAMKRRKKTTHRHTVTGVVGMDKLDGTFTMPTGAPHRANTWPLEAKHEEHATPKSPVNTELQLYIKNNSVVTIADTKSSRTSNVPSFQVHCVKPSKFTDGCERSPYTIALGSMLSLDLPKNWEHKSDMSYIDNTIQSGNTDVKFDSPKNQLLNSYRLPCLTSVSSKIIDLQTVTHSLEEEPEKKDMENVNSETVSFQCLLPLAKDLQCDHSMSIRSLESSVTLKGIPTDSTGIKEETEEDHDKPEVRYVSHEQCTELNRFPIIISHDHPCTEPSHNPHKCLSVHTKIRDLNGHIYRPFTKQQFTSQNDLIVQEVKGFTTGSGVFKSQGINRSEQLIVCTEKNCCVCSEHLVSSTALGKETSPSSSTGRASDPVHPDHWQFEEEEEELQDIWSGMDRERSPYSVPQMRHSCLLEKHDLSPCPYFSHSNINWPSIIVLGQ
ncbi:uncharacterized protein si:dkey-238i5.2 isoform X3 [Hypomesus transpacificus]|uniref:uncharacterized protein si:dkey-238i5.2 isoform X3 n=1 Tax=Hypomesus transpacificus TaxID=137520 RepID=UPI001F080979|nr:uncharacterized protein si:dkey-238i5.2 isoform X3 [Hypomesus transpacificus]